MCVYVCVLARWHILLLTIYMYMYIYIYVYWLDDKDFSSVDNCTNSETPIGKTAKYRSIQFNKMHLTKPLSKMLSNLVKLVKLNVFTDVSSRKSMYPQREISRNYWAWCPTLVGKKRVPSLVTYLILNQRNYIFTIILIMVAEIYSLSKSSSLSKYTVVYSKVWQKLFFCWKFFYWKYFPCTSP